MQARLLHPSGPTIPAPVRLMVMLLAVVGVLLGLVAMHAMGPSSSSSAISHSGSHAPVAESTSSSADAAQLGAPQDTPAITPVVAVADVGCGGLCDTHHMAMAMALACAMALLTVLLALRRRRSIGLNFVLPRPLPSDSTFSPTPAPSRPPSLTALSISRI